MRIILLVTCLQLINIKNDLVPSENKLSKHLKQIVNG